MLLKRTRLSRSLALAATSGLFAASALAQQATTTPPAQQLEKVEVTGSSIKRIDAETALPVQVISREQIQRSGATTVEQLLQTVAAMTSSQGLTSASASGATTGGISAISLRGLSPLRTLVLLNGRRIAPYGIGFSNDSVSVDVNSIPLSAIERVEVLKDGASAVYGSDAIAGVVNFIMRKEFRGIDLSAEYGDTTKGGANFKRGSITGGIGDIASDRYNVMGVLSVQKEGSLVGGDRDFSRSAFNERNDTTSGNTFPANIARLDGTGTRNPSAPGCPGPYAVNDFNFPSTRCRFDPAPLVTLIPATERISGMLNAKFALTPEIELFAEGSYNRNKSRTIIQPVPLSDQFSMPSSNPLCQLAPYNTVSPGNCVSAIVLHPTSAYYPTAYATAQYGSTPDLLVRYRSALTGNRDFEDIAEAPRLVGGVRGSAAGWDFDGNVLWTQSKVRENVLNGYPAYGLIMPILNSGNVNFFGPNTAAVQSQIDATQFRGDAFSIKSTLTSAQAKASREVFQLPGGPAGVAFGTEIRQEKYQFSASEAIQSGDISGYGGNFLPIDKSRNVAAVFGEFNLPILKGLEANLSARYDHYEGVGGTTNPKASLKWQPTPEVALRTSWGKGFRAPSLLDLYSANTQSVTVNGLSDPLRCPTTNSSTDCLTQFTVTFGGNPNLKPERSTNFTAGIVLQPTRDVSASLDYFNIQLKDTIVNGVDPTVILSDLNRYGSLVQRGPAQNGLPGQIINILQTNLNLGTTKVSGLDLDVSARQGLGDWGTLTLTGSATYLIKYDTENLDGSFSGNVGLANTATGGVNPRFKTSLTAAWSLGAWDASITNNYQDHYHDVAGNVDGVDRMVGHYSTWDLQGSYRAFKSWRFTLGMRNVFDTKPPYTNNGAFFQSGYDPTYGDPRGRYIYGKLNYSFM